ncbi:histone deacetylase 6 isoform X2 [Danaus plexippus]|uniref:histone deacetylase 6 isoform X2 n=1 Tax=Danaus plexippus TaxID=13037 RepID=UPI002AB13A36|nr:histone deacetylase 6 isoform X2 [Danaus plexippus]
MSTSSSPTAARRTASEVKKTSPSSIVTRNGARKAKIQTRAMAAAKPSASVVAAKRKAQQKKKFTMDTVLRDPYQTAMESKFKVKGATGFVTDPRMSEHRCLWDDNYPECPERLISVINRCQELNLIEQCKVYPPRSATREEVLELHAPSVYSMMEGTHQNQDLEYLEELSAGFDAVYIHPTTHELALSSAGCTLDMVERLVSDELQNAACMVRPPGHHAMRAEPCGYCIYNNAALAANRALKLGLQRILIVDWDVHHGQATQQMFYDDPRVVYFSIHRYEHGAFWPNLRQSDFPYTGSGQGEGHNFNVPLNNTGMTDADYIAIWHQLLLPMAFEFSPELIIVSAGYDAALGDEKGEMEVTPACYASLLHMLQGVCSRVLVLLEGGYCLRSLAEGAALTLRTLLGHAPPALPPLQEPCESIRDSILNCIYSHKKHWRCFNNQPSYSTDPSVLNTGERGAGQHTVVMKWEGDETRADRFATRNCYPLQTDDTRKKIQDRLNHLQLATDVSCSEHPVCYIYDPVMLKHHNVCEPGHVECPERIMRIHERHRDFGLLERVHRLPPRSAADDEILAVHTEKYLDSLKELSSTKLRDLNAQRKSFDSVYFHPDSLQSAAAAAGAVIQMVDAVLRHGSGGVCVVRPPGHHADEDVPSGFCLLNNVAVGARHARAAHGLTRIMILDWDVHHGNGTQRITYEDKEILYISIHRYDNGSFFPNSPAADHTAVGQGRGEGYNINIPWNKRGMGDAEYLSAMCSVVLPVAYEYGPQLVLVSAGFDAAVGDPLGGCKVTPECYGRMTHMLRGLAGGRVIVCLEGGYNVTSISYAMTMCTKALLGDPLQHQYDPKQTVNPSAVESINNVIRTHQKYWKSLKFQLALPMEDVIGPLPKSRGLPDSEPAPDHAKVVSDKLKKYAHDINLAKEISNLSIRNDCTDGIHCGTDDENDDGVHKTKTNDGAGASHGTGSAGPSGNKQNRTGSEPTTLVDYLSENMQAIVNEEMFAVIPLTWCPHLDMLHAVPEGVHFQQGVQCVSCDHVEENWVCLHCYITACGRHVNGHMQDHFKAAQHPLSLSLSDLSVWCSVCDAYVDNHLLYDAKNNAHRCKFGEDMPWCYNNTIQMH